MAEPRRPTEEPAPAIRQHHSPDSLAATELPGAKPSGQGLLAAGLWGEGEAVPSEQVPQLQGDGELGQLRRRSAGGGRSRQRAVVSRKPYRGRYARAVAAEGKLRDIAWDATLRSAAIRGRTVTEQRGGRLVLEPDELLRKVRVQQPDRLLLFVVDTSGSMGGVLTALARRIAAKALRDAYLKRAQVAMIAFRERSAQLLFRGTRKIGLVHRALDALPLGGTTPLGAGLELARRTLERQLGRDRGLEPTMILISDGRANVGSRPGYERVLAEVRAQARAIACLTDVRVLFLDTTAEGKNDRPAQTIARWLGAERVPLALLEDAHQDPAAALSIALH